MRFAEYRRAARDHLHLISDRNALLAVLISYGSLKLKSNSARRSFDWRRLSQPLARFVGRRSKVLANQERNYEEKNEMPKLCLRFISRKVSWSILRRSPKSSSVSSKVGLGLLVKSSISWRQVRSKLDTRLTSIDPICYEG